MVLNFSLHASPSLTPSRRRGLVWRPREFLETEERGLRFPGQEAASDWEGGCGGQQS